MAMLTRRLVNSMVDWTDINALMANRLIALDKCPGVRLNAFNMLNRTTALWNVCVLWPRCSRFLFNTYKGYECIYSKEGVTQGDTPFVSKSNFVQCWYTDDSVCAGKLSQIRLWFDKLIQLEPAYGYYAEPTKSVLVVAPQFEDVAKDYFKDLGITVSSNHRFLGGVFCTQEYCRNFMKQKVEY